jgi:hypothetical protein
MISVGGYRFMLAQVQELVGASMPLRQPLQYFPMVLPGIAW